MNAFSVGPRKRNLEHYPANRQRIWYLALVVISTIILYYESYVLPSVAPLVLRSFSISVQTYTFILLASNLIGVVSAIFGSLSDRLGRSNLIVYSLLITGLATLAISLANKLVSIFWILNVVSAIIIGFISDRTLVRKPYMLLGALAAIIVTILFISCIGQPTGAGLMAVFLSLFGITLSIGYVTWMAAYTETIEDISPALVATGMALEGAILRFIVVLSAVGFVFVVKNSFDGQQWAIWWWV